jgi:peptide/nickel transport system substrate-binding protein
VEQAALLASYWGGRSTQDQMYSTAYLSTADWNDTRFKRRISTRCCWRRAPNSTRTKRKQIYHDMAVMVRDEGGLILPMFNQFIDATGAKVERLGR